MKTPTINPDEMLKSMAAEASRRPKKLPKTVRNACWRS
jgi:hypothetical protein